MKKFIAFLILTSVFFQSCEKEKIDPLKDEYFYYTFNFEKIPLYLYTSEVLIEFNHTLSTDDAILFLNKYPFFSDQTLSRITTEARRLKYILNPSGTIQLFKIIKDLNQDTISYAVPVFTLTKNIASSYSIPLDEIVCDPLIPDSEFNQIISKYNLTIIKSKPEHLYYLLKINTINTGFEPLEIANLLYETGKFNYCHPNMLANISHFKK
jgi:hypothetical protein